MADWNKKSAPKSKSTLKQTQLADASSRSAAEKASTAASWKGRPRETAVKPFWIEGGGRLGAWRGMALFLSGLSILALTTLLVIRFTYVRRSTDCIVLAGLNFESPWMPNAWAKEDAERLHSWFNENENKQSLQCSELRTEGPKDNGAWKEILDAGLLKAQAGGPGGTIWPWARYTSMVVCISAHGVVQQGKPFLAFSSDAASWAPFSEVLDAIADHEKTKSLRMLIVVDSGRQLPDARIPLLSNDFVNLAKSAVKAKNRSHLAVLFSADNGQISWPAPELNGTVFGAYLAQGFFGMADANRNTKLTVRELADYVSKGVSTYVLRSRAATQQPVLVWSGEKESNFELSYCATNSTNKEILPANLDESEFASLRKAWNDFEGWRAKTLRTNPWLVAQVRDNISHADQLLWAGSHYKKQANEKLGLALKRMQESQGRSAKLAGTSRFLGKPPSPVFAIKAPPAEAGTPAPADAAASPPAAKPKPTFADLAKAWLEQPPAKDGKKTEPPLTKDFEEYTIFAWWWLKESPDHWSQAKLAKLKELWPPKIELPPSRVRQEEALLLSVFDDVESLSGLWDSAESAVNEKWPQYLRLLENVESRFFRQVESDPRILAFEETQVGMSKLLDESRSTRDQLHARRLPANTPSDKNLEPIQIALQKIEAKWQLLDQTADELPLLINWLLSERLATDIQDVMTAYAKLAADINLDDKPLRDSVSQLRKRYSSEVKGLLDDRRGATKQLSPEALQQIYLHIHHRPIDGLQRKELHDNLLVHFRSFESTSQSWEKRAGSSDDVQPLKWEPQIPSSLLRSFAGLIQRDFSASTDRREEEKLWMELIGDFSKSKGGFESLGSDIPRLRLEAKSVRLCANWVPNAPQYDAAQLEEQVAWQEYLLWRARGFAEDFWRTPELTAGKPYFAICSTAFVDEAEKLSYAPKARRDAVRSQIEQRQDLSLRWSNLLRTGSPRLDKNQKTLAVNWNSQEYPKGIARIWARMKKLGEWTSQHVQPIEVGGLSEFQSPSMPADEGRVSADYRGHTAPLPFDFGREQSQWTLVNDLLRDTKTTVKVSAVPQPAEIVFAIDCSRSYSRRNFDDQIDAIRKTLDNLRGRTNLKIAIVLFGHSRYYPIGGDGLNRDWSQKHDKFIGARFDSDVRDLGGLVPVTDAEIDKLESFFPDLKPHGATPLYFAIEHCKMLLDKSFEVNRDAPVQRRVIVITDGKNDVQATQGGLPVETADFRVNNRRTAGDVRLAFQKGATARIDVLHVDNDVAKDAALESVVNGTGGKYYELKNNQLADILADTLESNRYSITHAGKVRAVDQENAVRLGEEWQLKDPPSDESLTKLRVSITQNNERSQRTTIATRDIEVFTGERLEVLYDRLADRFTFPFDGYRGLSLKLGKGLQAWRIRSRTNDRDIRFVLDMQDSGIQTIRPKFAFVEVAKEPLKNLSAKAAFWTSDLAWESNTIRPTCRATFDGPQTDAVLPARLWVFTGEAGPKIVGTLDMKSVNPVQSEKPRDVAGFKVRVEGKESLGKYELSITVLPDSMNRLVAKPPVTPSKIGHQFFAGGQVIYNYTFDAGKPSGSIEFFVAPKEGDPHWAATDWVETEQ